MMVPFGLSFFPRGVLGEIVDLIESVSEGFPTYSWNKITSRMFTRHYDVNYVTKRASLML